MFGSISRSPMKNTKKLVSFVSGETSVKSLCVRGSKLNKRNRYNDRNNKRLLCVDVHSSSETEA